MSFEWLDVRINEERDRRQRETNILERLPSALAELNATLASCVQTYVEAFGKEAASIDFKDQRIRITVRDQKNGTWEPRANLTVMILPTLPGFKVEGREEPLLIEMGLLPADRLYYREGDEYIDLEEFTRRVLDRAFFPKLTN